MKATMAHQFDLASPVLITGRGGSGTRLLSNLLQQSRVFLGNRLNHQGDSLEWVKINRRILFDDIKICNNRFNNQWLTKLQSLAAGINGKYSGDEHRRWGLKLPEMLFMLPEFFLAFPDTKLIHLIRHPVGVSCRRTHITSRLDNPMGRWALPRAYEYLGLNKENINQSDILNNAISWKFQIDIITKFIENYLLHEQFIVVKFEDIILKPQVTLDRLGNFLGYLSTFQNLNLGIDKSRVQNNTLNDTKTIDEIWYICGETAQKYGYSKLDYQL